MLVGGISSSCDLISAEYGWTDDEVMELPLQRFQQIISAIKVRKYLDSREANSRVSWQTRVLASYIAAGYMTDGDNPALEKAAEIAIDDIEEALLGSSEQDDWKPGDPAILKNEPKAGSFEKLVGTLSQTK